METFIHVFLLPMHELGHITVAIDCLGNRLTKFSYILKCGCHKLRGDCCVFQLLLNHLTVDLTLEFSNRSKFNPLLHTAGKSCCFWFTLIKSSFLMDKFSCKMKLTSSFDILSYLLQLLSTLYQKLFFNIFFCFLASPPHFHDRSVPRVQLTSSDLLFFHQKAQELPLIPLFSKPQK